MDPVVGQGFRDTLFTSDLRQTVKEVDQSHLSQPSYISDGIRVQGEVLILQPVIG